MNNDGVNRAYRGIETIQTNLRTISEGLRNGVGGDEWDMIQAIGRAGELISQTAMDLDSVKADLRDARKEQP